MPLRRVIAILSGAMWMMAPGPLFGQEKMAMPNTTTRPIHNESETIAPIATQPVPPPSLPSGLTLEQTLDRAASPPPKDFPPTIRDDKLRAALLVQQLEYGFGQNTDDQVGWRAMGWIGFDYDKLWLRTEGSASVEGPKQGTSETDLLYSRLITPFWYAQAGIQYASDWDSEDYNDRWSGVLAVQGLAPGMFDVETSLYISEDADVTLRFEADFDLRLTQRLVLQPRTEFRFAAQDVPERSLGAGMTNADVELRLRYEIKRDFAPYIGIGYHRLVGETSGLARAAGDDPEELLFFVGVRFAF